MSQPVCRRVIRVLLLCALAGGRQPHAVYASAAPVRFAVIGDFGTGTPQQYELASVMAAVHARSPYDMVLMAGDNIFGGFDTFDSVEAAVGGAVPAYQGVTAPNPAMPLGLVERFLHRA